MLEKPEQREAPGDASIAILERVNAHKTVVQPGASNDWVGTNGRVIKLNQAFHLDADLFRRRVLEYRSVGTGNVIWLRFPLPVMEGGIKDHAGRSGRFVGRLLPGKRYMQFLDKGDRHVSPAARRLGEELQSVVL